MRGLLRGASLLSGAWFQMMASRFAHETTQLGEKCITWNITFMGQETWNVHQHSHLYYMIGFDQDKDFRVRIKKEEDKWMMKYDSTFHPDLWIRNSTEDAVMLMGTDNLTYFILARNPEVFERDYREPMVEILKLWDYDSYYKTGITTYELTC